MSTNASRCGSRRRRPIVSPPGGGMRASPKRASSGPASRNEARMRAESASSSSVSADRVGLEGELVVARPRRLHPDALEQRDLRLDVADARDVGQPTSSSVSRQAARIGSAAFLFPATVISPERGVPPWMTNFSIWAARVNRSEWLSRRDKRPGTWSANGSQSDSLRKHLLGVEAGHGRLRAQVRRGRGALGGDGPRPRHGLRALPRPRDRASPLRAQGAGGARATRRT